MWLSLCVACGGAPASDDEAVTVTTNAELIAFEHAGEVKWLSAITWPDDFPVVADIDHDGFAEILVRSNTFGSDGTPALQAIRDTEGRWLQARRIWNRHSCHVTNVREDGTIPTVEPKSWTLLNTFRTNAQIQAGRLCEPAG